MPRSLLLCCLLFVMAVVGCQPTNSTAPATGLPSVTAPSAAAGNSTTTSDSATASDSVANVLPGQAAGRSEATAVNFPLEAPTAGDQNKLSREELEAGWLRLFDGYTLFGWKQNSDTAWSVKEGVIVGEGETPGLLCTTTNWANYELRVDFRIASDGNSGIFLRTPLNPKDPTRDCYELNICDSHPKFRSGSLVGREQPTLEIKGNGDWHTFLVLVQGPQVTVRFDGEEVLKFTDSTESPLQTGRIGLQMNGGRAEFRNVFLRPLGMSELFDGTSLTGWRVVPGSEGDFQVEDGTIRVTGGRGFLETEQTADNFVLQFEAITHGEALNSGIFFRAQPGTESNPSDGYEFQIQNGVKDGDRTRPLDHGTGAIFRRISARRVVSSDNAWFTATLVADGPHVTTWVDGVQVVDWTDDRAPHENPRQGLRLAAGHFSLQAHDPTTNLQFRRIRLSTLPPANGIK